MRKKNKQIGLFSMSIWYKRVVRMKRELDDTSIAQQMRTFAL